MLILTPDNISKPIIKLAKQLVASPYLIYVDVIPEPSFLINECYENVRIKIQRDGGNIQYGWQIWEWFNVYIEAEFHAVWLSPSNQYVDITPKAAHVTKILFLPDPNRTYNNRSIDNERRPLRQDKLIRDFLRTSKEINRMKMKGEVPNNPNKTFVDQSDYEYWAILHDDLMKMLINNLTENSPCFCGSNKQYKHCHSL